MDALKQLENLIDSFIEEAESLKDRVYILDTDVRAEAGFSVTDDMIIVNKKNYRSFRGAGRYIV